MKSIQRRFSMVKIDLTKMVPVDRGFARRKTGERIGNIELVIDLSRLEYIARRALASKRGRAIACKGAITAKVITATESAGAA